ncbi:MAG: glycosyl hydrolase 115 family protein [Amaricoccus sp.]|uniref:glycosyl hydrolase 115 family protein n=1 Tax=Amaricoccus sp. TaxID=1872485 RepID=UPI0039E33B67
MVAPGTWIFPDDGQVQLAGKRGLWLSQHHATPLGVNMARWPAGVPYNYSVHPEIIQKAWRNAVNTYKPDQDILWELGLRGLSDVSYAALDPSVRDNEALLGKRISDAIAEQQRIVREHHPNALFVTDLWSEGNRLMRDGVLKIPSDVITVWSDTGYGKLQDDGQARAGQGAYFHIAMMNDRANQLSEMVPVDRLLSETQRLADHGATQFFLVNTSDLRPVVMSARATMEAAWGNLKQGEAHAYYKSWAKEEFGVAAADAIANVYESYFAAPAHAPNGEEYGDQYYHTTARRMLLNSEVEWPSYVLPDQAPIWQAPHLQGAENTSPAVRSAVDRERAACSSAVKHWQSLYGKASQAMSLVEPSRRSFYESSVLTMISINMESNEMLLDVANAIEAKDAGHPEQAVAEIHKGQEALVRLKQAEARGEYGRWKNWYHGDWLTGVSRTQDALAQYEKHLLDSSTPVPPPIRWSDWEAYYHILHYEGDRTVDLH